jgi:hypothetical protein
MKAARLTAAGAVLLALGAIAGAAQLAGPGSPGPARATAPPRLVAVTSAVRACPPIPGGGPGTVAFIARPSPAPQAGPGQAGPGQAGPGQAELAPLPSADAALRAAAPISQTEPGVLSTLTIPAAQSVAKKAATVPQGWSVTATGTMAQAMEAEEATGSGSASVRCGEPGSDLWFVGPGQQNGAGQIQLDLMNVDALAASVNVSVVTDAGPVQAGNDTGITVPPRQTVTESLSALAAGSSVAAIEVRTSMGRVAADVSESTAQGGTASWLPATAPPSTQLLIPGVASSGSAARLFIVVPGSSDARVSVLAITSQGRYRPFGAQPVDVPGDSASYVPLTPLGGTASALELTANVPVAAAVLVPGTGLGTFTASTAPISEQAVVAGNTSGSGLSTTVVLSAPAGPARVRLTELTPPAGSRASGATASQEVTASQQVTVPVGRTLAVPVTIPRGGGRGAAFAVVITPLAGSGPLYAARVQTQGQGSVVSIIPAISALTTISLPPVRDSYAAISP